MTKNKSIENNFIRFKATDGVELRGWLTDTSNELAVIHVHGRAGNGYENYFLDDLRAMFNKNNIAFFAFDNRGSGVLNTFWTNGEIDKWGEGTKLGGSCYEIFDESELDIQGAINYLKTLGKNKFILMGHSLGGSKVVNYVLKNSNENILAAILLAPTDMIGWANTDKNNNEYLEKAKLLLSQGKGTEIVGFQCWLDKTPISAQGYPGVSESNTSVDIYADKNVRSSMGNVTIPMLIAYGDSDIGITEIDGNIDNWLKRTEKIKNENTKISIIKNASHSFKGYEEELVNIVEAFLQNLS
jgi:alpha-beta hydrolase superfamily lysophospholipase